MTEPTEHQTVTCTLTEEEVAARMTHVQSTLSARYTGAEERPNGYAISFAANRDALEAITRFVTHERQCCSFATYQITVSPPYEEYTLTITGPDGTKAHFANLIDLLAGHTPPVLESASDRSNLNPDAQRSFVRETYARVANATTDSDGASDSSCCSGSRSDVHAQSRLMGYSDTDLDSAPQDANLGLGCGNPIGLAQLTTGDTVVDLGSGAGFDCFLAAQEVGPDGHVIGVDMTPEMVEKARENAKRNETPQVEFRLGEIEHLPVRDESVDVIISNCVLNLSPDKAQVFEEAFRVLKPDGELAISDIVTTSDLPADVTADPSSVAACIAGGASIDTIESILVETGFEDIQVEPDTKRNALLQTWDDSRDVSDFITSATIKGRKPSK